MTVHSWGHAIDIRSANNNINYAVSKAMQFANERDAYAAQCNQLKREIDDHNEEFRQYKHKYNGLVRDFNNLVHTVTERNEVIEMLEADVDACKELIQDQDAEIAELKAIISKLKNQNG